MRLWNKLAQDLRVMKILVAANGMQFVIIIGLLICLASIPTRFTFHIPPDLSNGATLHADKIPNAYVGDFSFYVWQALNHWQDNGSVDADTNLANYGPYLSPSFRYSFSNQIKALEEGGDIQGRVKDIEPVSGIDPQVTKIDAHTWEVLLTVRETEYVNGILVKDKEIQYPMKVITYNGDAQTNQYGLVLDGFFSDPQILKTVK